MHIGFAFYGLFHNVGFLPVSLFYCVLQWETAYYNNR